MNKANNILFEKMRAFHALIDEQYNLYEKMYLLCQEERGFIEAGEWGKLNDSLRKKHYLLEHVVRVESQAAELKAMWREHKHTYSEPIKEEISKQIETFRLLMERLVTLQKDNEDLLTNKKENQESSLSVVKKERMIHDAYRSPLAAGDARYMDKKQ